MTTPTSAIVAASRPRGPRGRAPISVSISENRAGRVNPRSKKAKNTGSIIETTYKNVAQTPTISVGKQQSPAWRQIGIFNFASAQTPDQVHEPNDYCRDQDQSEKGMGETAMMSECECRTEDSSEDV